jgi:hypothetical protein
MNKEAVTFLFICISLSLKSSTEATIITRMLALEIRMTTLESALGVTVNPETRVLDHRLSTELIPVTT